MRRHFIVLVLPVFSLLAAPASLAAPSASSPLTLTRIMANPDWIAMPPENPYWSADAGTVYFSQRAHQAPTETLHAVNLSSGKVDTVPDADWSRTGSTQSVFDHARSRELYVNHGDLFLKEVATGKVTQLTRGLGEVGDPQFVPGHDMVSYEIRGDFYLMDLATGMSSRAADVKAEQAPDQKQGPYHYYSAEQ
ncbi:MAG TPA: hypothetical protein VKA04_05060, partial [Pseudodesulfovibrio sp.]|nr:hypothetical protein [Pseudodesulfovibrio sp.]